MFNCNSQRYGLSTELYWKCRWALRILFWIGNYSSPWRSREWPLLISCGDVGWVDGWVRETWQTAMICGWYEPDQPLLFCDIVSLLIDIDAGAFRFIREICAVCSIEQTEKEICSSIWTFWWQQGNPHMQQWLLKMWYMTSRKKKNQKDGSDVATSVDYGVASSLSWS